VRQGARLPLSREVGGVDKVDPRGHLEAAGTADEGETAQARGPKALHERAHGVGQEGECSRPVGGCPD
jgi:hypothetical protein